MTKRKDPFWCVEPDPQNDIAQLRPETLSVGQRFETRADVSTYSELNEIRLQGGNAGHRNLAEILSECRTGEYLCGLVVSPICARLYRRWVIGETIRIVRTKAKAAHIVTLHLEDFERGFLNEAHLPTLRRRARARLRRCRLPKGVTAIGGIEVSMKNSAWVAHMHLVVLGATEHDLNTLASKFIRRGVKRAALVQSLNDLAKQLSYLQKFATYHRPGKQHKSRRARAYPLSAVECREFADWTSRYTFTDFLFLYGARRRGSRIIVGGR
jgi:hypothetical protein